MGIETLKGIIYFGHGARDVRWREPFDRLQELWQEKHPNVPCALAFLEMMSPSLSEAIETLIQEGVKEIKIVPVFFGQGGHLRKDFPILLENAKTQFPQITLSTSSAVGESDLILNAILEFSNSQW
jgi:sirohydrochlorin cobaltochelatase